MILENQTKTTIELDSNVQVIKEAHKLTREARKDRDYYKGLAGMYQLTYDDDMQVHQCIMLLQGIYVELQSDLLQFKQKNGHSDRVSKSQRRLDLLHDQLDTLSKIQTSNVILKNTVRTLEAKNHLQWCEINDLKSQLQLHTENL